MKQRFFSVFIIFTVVFILSSCSNKKILPEGVVNDEIKAFTLNKPSQYSGIGQYFHEIQKVNQLSESPYIYELTGEVKSDASDRSKKNHQFSIKGFVDETSWVETYDDSRLSESDLRQVVLLKEPLDMGAKWEFKTTDKLGEKKKIWAEIVSKSEDEIEVVYRGTGNFYEKRIFRKTFGTVKFVKEFEVGSTKAVTGYAFFNEISDKPISFDTLKPIDIEPDILTIIRSFNENLLLNALETAKNDVLEDSPAIEKLALNREGVLDWSFEGLKAYQKKETESSIKVRVLEKYRQKDSVYYNAVEYEMIYQKNKYYIYDFEPVSFDFD